MKLSKREKILIGIFGILLLGFLYYRFIFSPMGQTISNLETEYKSKQILLEQKQNKAKMIEDINLQIQNIDKELQSRKGDIQKPISVPNLILEISDAAKNNNLTIKNLQFSNAGAAVKGTYIAQGGTTQSQATLAGDANLKELSISITFISQYRDFVNFQKYFEQNSRLFIVSTTNVTRNAKNFSGEIVLNTFSVAPEGKFVPYDLSIASSFK